MKNKFFQLIFLLVVTSFLSGCNFIEFIDQYNSFINNSNEESNISDFEYTDEIKEENKTSLEILNQVFNGTKNNKNENIVSDFSNITNENEFENARRLDIKQNIKSLDYFVGTTPQIGKINSLVIPIEFEDYPAPTNINIKSNNVYFQSVSSYYYNSSYGKLDFNFDILNWFKMGKNASYYKNYKSTYEGDVPGVSLIINEIFTALESKIDFSKYDNDKDGYIDSLYIIYSHPINNISSDFWWAFQYCYFENHTWDGVCPYYYVFAGFDFIFQNDKNVVSADTYIHETGHMLGLSDYYDYDLYNGYNKGALGGADMMDCNIGDHNPFSKLSLGWINNPILVELDSKKSTTLSIQPFSKNGDVIIICDNYDEKKGIFQDYFLVIYYDNDHILNSNQNIYSKDGIRVYRIHAELETYKSSNNNEVTEYQYFKYDNSYSEFNLIDSIVASSFSESTSNGYGIYSNLYYNEICATDSDLFLKDYLCNDLCYYDYRFSNKNIYSEYYFEVDDINEDYATLTFGRL